MSNELYPRLSEFRNNELKLWIFWTVLIASFSPYLSNPSTTTLLFSLPPFFPHIWFSLPLTPSLPPSHTSPPDFTNHNSLYYFHLSFSSPPLTILHQASPLCVKFIAKYFESQQSYFSYITGIIHYISCMLANLYSMYIFYGLFQAQKHQSLARDGLTDWQSYNKRHLNPHMHDGQASIKHD